MNELISICIPSYQRPEHLVEAVESCFASIYRPLEILIGDDSRDDESEYAVSAILTPDGIEIRYRRNVERLGQPANVNSLFDDARGDRLILLHDDDRLMPGAVDVLASIWNKHEDLLIVFGKQRVIDSNGRPLGQQTDSLNRGSFRTSDKAGLQESVVASALIAQVPNDGYLVLKDAARKVRYSDYTFRGDGRDYDFSVRLALAYQDLKCYFADETLVDYRLSESAISHVSPGNSYMFQRLSDFEIPDADQPALAFALQRVAAGAVLQFATRRKQVQALGVFFSRYYPVRRLSLKGVFHLATIAFPPLSDIRRRQRVANVRATLGREGKELLMEGPNPAEVSL